MPLVTAADYPVQRGPTTSPAAPEALRGDYQNLPAATPEAFGATVGAAQQQLGRSFEQAGDVLKNAAVARQDFLNKTATDKATNDYYDKAIALSYGDPNTPGDTGFHGKQGQDAVTAFPGYRDALGSERERIRGTLTNPLQQLEFDNATRRLQATMMERAGGHFDLQMRADAVNTSQARADNASRSITAAVANNDDRAFNYSVKDLMESMLTAATAQHGTLNNDQINDVLGKAREKAIIDKAEGLGVHDSSAALQFLENNKEAINPLKFAEEYHKYDGRDNRAQGRAIATQIQGGAAAPAAGGGGAGGAAALVRKYESEGLANQLGISPYNIGVGGKDLSNAPHDEFGFPKWEGKGDSHAAGAYQFQPDTWRKYAGPLGIKDFSPASQDRVFQAAHAAEGWGPWEPYNPTLAAALKRGETGGAGAPDTVTGQPTTGVTARPAAAGAAAPVVTPAAAERGPGLAPLPDLDAQIQRVNEMLLNGQIKNPETANLAIAHLRSDWNRDRAAERNDREALKRNFTNGLAALQDGRAFDYSPETYKHFFPREAADEMLQALDDAKDAGHITNAVRTSSQEDIKKLHDDLYAKLNEPGAPDYVKRAKQVKAFDEAFNNHYKNLFGPEADPANYLNYYDQPVQSAHSAIDPRHPDPKASTDYATLALSEQARLGVPEEKQHVLSVPEAQGIAQQLGANPENAPAVMRQLEAQWGPHWPHVWSDMVTLGKLPAAYQVVGELADFDPGDAALLSRTLGARAKDDKAFETSIGRRVSGGKSVKQVVSDAVEGSDPLKAYEQSLRDTGASESQVGAIHSAIEHLAAGRVLYRQEDASEATDKALDALLGHYRFMPNGGARVPANRYDDVSSNARTTLDRLSLDNVQVPDVYGRGPTAPPPQNFVDELKARATWITGPKADRMILMDHAGRIVHDKNGNNVEVRFSDGRIAPPPAAAPQAPSWQVPY